MGVYRQLKMSSLLVSPAHLGGGWRYPGAAADGLLGLEFHSRTAKKAEEGLFDMLFLSDKYAMSNVQEEDALGRGVNAWPEPITLLSSMIGVTRHIGLAATVSTTYQEPYHLARMLASMDHLSGGRAAWNIVTSRGDAYAHNFTYGNRIPLDKRHEYSEEFVSVVKALWDSWEDDAFRQDRSDGRYMTPSKVHPINHEGQWFQIRGPLTLARPPQGHPVMIQAGESDTFKERAARNADMIFTAQPSFEDAKPFYHDVKSRMGKYGRSPDDLVIMPGLQVTVGRTEAEVREKEQLWQRAMGDTIRKDHVSLAIGLDVRDYPLDALLPDLDSNGTPPGARYKELKAQAAALGLRTIVELYRHVMSGAGHLTLKGTPSQIADELTRWLMEYGADGFNLLPRHLPGELDDFVELVVPELQNRGVYRSAYTGNTLRDHLGLARPLRRE